MRVLIYAPAARVGGARAHVLGLLPELAAIGSQDDVLVVAQPDLVQELPALPSTWQLRTERAETRGFLGRLLWEQRALPRLAEQWRADVLLSFGAFVPLRSPCPCVLEAGNALYFTRAYWHVLEHEPLRMRVEERARWKLLRASLRSAERILAPTRAMRTDVVTRLPGLGPKVDVVLWGVAPIFHRAHWQPPAGDTILGVSRHSINKEFDVLIAALPLVRRRQPAVRLVLTGTADESRWSRRSVALAHQLGVQDRVCFAGDVPNPDVPELIQKSRVLIFPTWCESFGLPLAEGLAMGAPAIAGDIPACREVGGDAAGYYATGDAQSMADRIDELLAAPEAAEAVAVRARERGRVFQWRDNALGVHATLRRAAA
jgi:alpha-1,3-rhamnosyl/mannosyltransferase